MTSTGLSRGQPQPLPSHDELTACLLVPELDAMERCARQYQVSHCTSHATPAEFDFKGCIDAARPNTRKATSQAVADCSDQRLAAERRGREQADANHRACDDLVNLRINDRKSAEQACSDGRASACVGLKPEKLSQLCFQRCFSAHDRAIKAEAAHARSVCEQEYVDSKGKDVHECKIDNALEDPGADVAALETRLRDGLEKALLSRDANALDKLFGEAQALDRFRLKKKCTAACRKRGPELAAAVLQGPALITAYKRCMVAADSTQEARKWAAYERDLYCGHLARANQSCRTAHRCDWVESHVELQCTYVSPGVGDCDLTN